MGKSPGYSWVGTSSATVCRAWGSLIVVTYPDGLVQREVDGLVRKPHRRPVDLDAVARGIDLRAEFAHDPTVHA